MSREEKFFAAVAARQIVRTSVRAIVLGDRGYLVQRPTDVASSHYAFIGGEYELGDSFQSRLSAEFEEETTAQIINAQYRFVLENRFVSGGNVVQTLEHYFEVRIDREEITSREPYLEQVWLSRSDFAEADVRPLVVRNTLQDSGWRDVRHLVAEQQVVE